MCNDTAPLANGVGVRVSTGSLHAHPSVQETVIGLVFTDHERRIVRLRAVRMVNHSTGRQWTSERTFGA
jgi:hypothetical protein